MADPMLVAANERETVRVFALDLGAAQAKHWLAVQSNLEAALGAALDPAHIEAFPASDLAGLGLAQFLVDGYGIAQGDITPQQQTLDSQTGHIVLLRARAFGGTQQRLDPKPPLRHLGTYGQLQAEIAAPSLPRPPEPVDVTTPAASPTRDAPKGSLAPLLIFAALAVIVFAILIVPKL